MSVFLAVAAIALLSGIGVGYRIRTGRQEREMNEKFAMLKLLLQNPGEEGARVMAAWREQDSLARVRGRRQRLRGGAVTLATGVALSAMLRVLSPGSVAWTIGFIPGLVGCEILAFAFFDRLAGIESRA